MFATNQRDLRGGVDGGGGVSVVVAAAAAALAPQYICLRRVSLKKRKK